jgi:hypothetical protein
MIEPDFRKIHKALLQSKANCDDAGTGATTVVDAVTAAATAVAASITYNII